MRPLNFLKNVSEMACAGLMDHGQKEVPVFCGFVPSTFTQYTVSKNGSVRGFVSGTTTTGDEGARACILLHMEAAESVTIDTQVDPTSAFYEIEARLNTCERAYLFVDAILTEIQNRGVLRQVFARYDEPATDLSLTLGYGAHSAVVELPGVCPYVAPLPGKVVVGG